MQTRHVRKSRNEKGQQRAKKKPSSVLRIVTITLELQQQSTHNEHGRSIRNEQVPYAS